ncbi:MAG: hypothetical protein ACQEWV_15420 [Bacillota bacterium]
MAAQPLVRDSYDNPIETYEINLGSVYLFEAIRSFILNKGNLIRTVIM